MIEFGPYAAYIWPAYALTAGVMLGLLVLSVARLKRRQRELQSYERAAGPHRRRTAPGPGDDEDE